MGTPNQPRSKQMEPYRVDGPSQAAAPTEGRARGSEAALTTDDCPNKAAPSGEPAVQQRSSAGTSAPCRTPFSAPAPLVAWY